MGKKSKTGKSRKDKFYHLAKETGYRARSAFKLIQLNRKYEFLQKSRVVIDLCAAPGGWLQVVAENTPISSLIVGVDLVPIRPVRNCKTLVEDITSDKCRQSLKKELQTWKADSVIHDGAGNVGKNWLHDAFQQAHLTLQALKLATEFLKKGGWFVTKVFRSKDYNSLLWVFQQLFQKVHATKPQASRNESAEIFVVCEKFLAPSRIDPKFLDAKFVFKEVDMEPRQMINLIHPEKKRRHRDGYAEGDYTLYHTLKVSEFIDSDNHLDLMAQSNALVFDDDRIAKLPETTEEIKECLGDLKVLGKRDIKLLIKWRTQVRKSLGKDEESKDKTEDKVEEVVEDSEDEEAQIEAQLAEAKDEERKVLKRKLKKVRREKARLRLKMDMKMVIPGDKFDFTDDVGLFNLNKMKSKADVDRVEAGENHFADEFVLDELEADMETTSHQKRETYDRDGHDHIDELYSSSENEEDLEEPDLEDVEDEDDAEEEEMEFEDDEEVKKDANPLIVNLEKTSTQVERKLKTWFNKESFAGLEDEADEDVEIEKMMEDYKRRGGTITGKKEESKGTKSKQTTKKDVIEEGDSGVEENEDSDSEMSDTEDKDAESVDNDKDDDDSDESDSESSDSDFDTTDMKKSDQKHSTTGFEEVPAGYIDATGLAIGAAMVQSRKRKRDIVDGGYHRYMFDDDNLPEWFAKEEAKHNKREMPVTKGDVQEYLMKKRSIDARPIKKIAQAKARKKKKEMRRLDKARKKSEVISDTADITDRDRWQQIKQVYKKAGLLTAKKKEVTYVVAKKGGGKRPRRPTGVKGPYKVVDGRMKKDMKKKKEQLKMEKKKGKKGGKRMK
ncbi:pre-rRNA processing protein FTSJ3-like [Mizuhopecten yessoensis]|uniref:Putative rRNA methyltransferase n=1 Tax=Mizuhopecten yessoensis TaxID=6573 RepID=A0A210Q816_MIZYE|nr:pre-rRNA processing protein FTSJ3-like [Mizuhopecten yessoensis]OWF44886.1 pre-rRNA processing protein FTSJ3 [Mizuhopecten yessoensis]